MTICSRSFWPKCDCPVIIFLKPIIVLSVDTCPWTEAIPRSTYHISDAVGDAESGTTSQMLVPASTFSQCNRPYSLEKLKPFHACAPFTDGDIFFGLFIFDGVLAWRSLIRYGTHLSRFKPSRWLKLFNICIRANFAFPARSTKITVSNVALSSLTSLY